MTREEKLKIIRDGFANQGIRENGKMSGWARDEIAVYLKIELGIDYMDSQNLTDAQIDSIVENLRQGRMI